LGLPDNGLFDLPIRELVPLNFRGKQSNNAWSSCGSCHPDGLADGVTWFFGTGPRQTIPLDGMFAKDNPDDQRLLNWSAVRGSNHDFNNNSRATQGGCGFASDAFAPGQCLAQGPMTPANPAIYDHGITQGGSDALDAQTLWIFAAVRPLRQPPPSDAAAVDRGREVVEEPDLPPRQPGRRRPGRGPPGPRRAQPRQRVPLVHLQRPDLQLPRRGGDLRCH
jgi:hypothetical protein